MKFSRKISWYSDSKRLVALGVLCVLLFSGCKNSSGDTSDNQNPIITPPDTELNTPGPQATTRDGDFTIVVIPDTQYYIAQPQKGGNLAMFKSQIDWIQNNQEKENIAYVAHVGDITENGDNPTTAGTEWFNAKTILYGLENPKSVPYGLAVGNHDQYPSGYAVKGTTVKYNQYFGVKHFEGRPYYGGHYGNNNDSHYDLFSAGGVDFIVIYIEFDSFNEDQAGMNSWAYELLGTYASRKAIIVSHSIMSNNRTSGSNEQPGNFSAQGLGIYNRLKSRPNVFMMVNGHYGDNGEGYREDVFEGRKIRTFLSDYQSRVNGGDGLMRLYKISVSKNQIDVKTFSPYTNTFETDGDSQFTTGLFN